MRKISATGSSLEWGQVIEPIVLDGEDMTSESCSVCGEEADVNELDPHGHFSSDGDDDCAICGDEHFVVGNKPDHEWTNGI